MPPPETPPAAFDEPASEDLERRRELVGELVVRMVLVRRPPATLMLIGLMGLVFGLTVSMGGASDPVVLSSVAKINRLVAQGQWWRLVSSVFVHVGLFHLVGNAFLLFFLGRMVENALGRRWLLVIFVIAGVGGAIASFFGSPQPSVGASGAVSGVLGAAIASGLKHRKTIPDRLFRQLAVPLIPAFALALAFMFTGEHVDNAAHLGGLLVGALLGVVASSQLLSGATEGTTRPGRTLALNLAVAASVALLLYGTQGALVSALSMARSG